MALIHHWPMDENTGDHFHDIAGTDHLVATGTLGWAAGYNSHLACYAVEDVYAEIPNRAISLGAFTEMTISFWIYRSSISTASLGGIVRFDDGGSYTWCNGQTILSFGTSVLVPWNKWTHVVWTAKNGENQRLYLDGVQVDTQAAFNFGAGFSSIRLGSWDGEQAFRCPGLLQDFMIYSHALTAPDVTALYASQLAPAPDLPSNTPGNGLLCLFKFDAASTGWVRDSSQYRRYVRPHTPIEYVYDTPMPGGALRYKPLQDNQKCWISGGDTVFNREQFTIAFYNRTSQIANIWGQIWFGHWNAGGAGGTGFYMAVETDMIRVGINTAAGPNETFYDSTYPTPTTDWQLYVGTFDMTWGGSGTIRHYLNGALFDTKSVSIYEKPSATEEFSILNGWFGDIQMFGFWDRILTDAEISTLYSDAVAVSSNGIAGSFLASDGCSNQINPGYYNPLIHRF